MERKYIVAVISFTVLALCSCAIAYYWHSLFAGVIRRGAPQGYLSLVVEPDDGIRPVMKIINSAAQSINLVIYELDDSAIEAALVAAEQRGVAVRVIMSAGYDGAVSKVNAPAYDFLKMHGVPVRWSPSYFSLTHEKSLVADDARALIMTFNLVAKYYPTGRDFGIIDTDPHDVAAMGRTFNADWQGIGRDRGGNGEAGGDGLLWSPGSEPALLDLIRSARRSLIIYNEEMADPDITKTLIDAAMSGVTVDIVMTDSFSWKWQFAELVTAGAHVRTYADDNAAPLYIHAKMIVADGVRAFVGSENFSKPSLEKNRELGVLTGDRSVIQKLLSVFMADWRTATTFSFDELTK